MFPQNTALAPAAGAKVLPFPGLDLGLGVRFDGKAYGQFRPKV